MRSGHWLVALVFGVIVLGAIPFYITHSCHSRACSRSTAAPFGRAFNPVFLDSGLHNWATVYWVVAVAAGLALLLVHHRHRARQVGVQGRLWPALVAGSVLLALVLAINDTGEASPGDLWIRGTSVLLVLALAVAVDAYLERSGPFALFAAGFIGLAVLSCLYTVVNLFYRLHIAGPFSGPDAELPNLVLPGAYLLLGGIGFLLGRGWTLQVRLARLAE